MKRVIALVMVLLVSAAVAHAEEQGVDTTTPAGETSIQEDAHVTAPVVQDDLDALHSELFKDDQAHDEK